MGKNPKCKMAAATILNFGKVQFFVQMTLAWQMSIGTQNLVKIGPEVAELHLFTHFQDGGRRPSWIYLNAVLDLLSVSVSVQQNWKLM